MPTEIRGEFLYPLSTYSQPLQPLPPLRRMNHPVVTAPSYSRASFEPHRLTPIAHWAVREIKRLRTQAIVAIGHSGLVVAGAVSVLSGVPVFAVRKNGEEHSAHYGELANGVAPKGPVARWVFLDDFISSGASLRWSALQVWRRGLTLEPIPQAVLTYHGSTSRQYVDEAWSQEIPWPGMPEWLNKTIPVINYERNDLCRAVPAR